MVLTAELVTEFGKIHNGEMTTDLCMCVCTCVCAHAHERECFKQIVTYLSCVLERNDWANNTAEEFETERQDEK